jgi:uncharacterized RDD family membrane protein YckC
MSPELAPITRFCSQCGRPYPAEDLARFGDQLICVSCKDVFTQRWREGADATTAVEYAGFWIRVGAQLIDSVILFILQTAVQAIFGPLFLGGRDSSSQVLFFGLVYLFSFAVGVSYESFLVARYAATPGKMALGLKVVRADGGAVQLPRAIGRYFAKMISGLILAIGYIMVGFDAQKRGLHDMMCDTRVVKAR